MKYYLKFFGFFFICTASSAQKLNFKSLEFASFDFNSTVAKNFYYGFYVKIDSSGKMIIRSESLPPDKVDYFTYKINPKEIRILNKVYNPNRLLSSQFKTKKMERNVLYAAFFDFSIVDYSNMQKDTLCTIEIFMEKDYQKMVKTLIDIINSSRKRKIKPFKIPNSFIYSLSESYKRAKFLPKKVKLSSFKL